MVTKLKAPPLVLDGEEITPPPLEHVQIDDSAIKDEVHAVLMAGVKRLTGAQINREAAKALVEAVLETLLFGAIRVGYVRLPRGFGSFHLRTQTGPLRRRLPSGRLVEMTQPRVRLKYEEGLAIRDLLGKPDKHPHRRKPRTSAVTDLLADDEKDLVFRGVLPEKSSV